MNLVVSKLCGREVKIPLVVSVLKKGRRYRIEIIGIFSSNFVPVVISGSLWRNGDAVTLANVLIEGPKAIVDIEAQSEKRIKGIEMLIGDILCLVPQDVVAVPKVDCALLAESNYRLWFRNISDVAVSPPDSDGWTLKHGDACQFNRVFRSDKGFPDSGAKPGTEILSCLSSPTVAGKIEFAKILVKGSPEFIAQVNFLCWGLVLQIDPRRDGSDQIVLFVDLR